MTEKVHALFVCETNPNKIVIKQVFSCFTRFNWSTLVHWSF